jgi:predicted RNA-binding Zn-ribbon protein involved in translation (DUF1610 family)
MSKEDPAATAPTNPPCPKCATPMRVTLMRLAGARQETRTLNCVACGHAETLIVKY